MKPYAIYVRQSLDPTGAASQLNANTMHATSWLKPEVAAPEHVLYSDNDLSASDDRKRRPGYRAVARGAARR